MALVRSSVAVLCVAAVAVLFLSTASAVDYNTKCKTMSASDMDGEFFHIMANDVAGAPTCYYFVDAGETADPKIIVEYTHAMKASGLEYDLMVWNIDQVDGWGCSAAGVGTSFTNVRATIDGATNRNFGCYNTFSTASTSGGLYNVNFTTTHNVGMVLAPNVHSNPALPAFNRDAPYTYKLAAVYTEFDIAVTEPFDTMQMAALTVDITVTSAEILTTHNNNGMRSSSLKNQISKSPKALQVEQDGAAVITFTRLGFTDGIERGETVLTFKVPTLRSNSYNWKETGPWRTGTLSVTSTTYPTITSTWKKFDLEGLFDMQAILGNGLWWQSATLYHQFGGDSAPTGSGFSQVDDNIKYAVASVEGKAGTENTVDGPIRNLNLLGASITATSAVSKFNTLSGGKQVATYYYVIVEATSASDYHSKPTHIWMRADYKDLTGECLSNADCNPGKDDDTVAGQVLSANGDRARMRTCTVLPSPFDFMTFSTRCIECTSESQCGAGQYCHVDVGMCAYSSGQLFVCDSASNALAGICREKDPSGIILGKPCATDTTYEWSDSSDFTKGATVSEGAGADSITGNGLCGEARYYNVSYVPKEQGFIAPAGVARRELWSGHCLGGVCQECVPDDNAAPFTIKNKESVQCVNGREVERRDVDFTIRTLTSNTIAGILLTAVIGIIIILIFLCFNAKQTMSKGDTYRKSLRQKYEDEQLVRAKSGRV